jgi:hypothetical protein
VCVVTDLEANLTVLIYPGINGADSFALQFGNVLDYAAPRFSEPASQFILRARAPNQNGKRHQNPGAVTCGSAPKF